MRKFLVILFIVLSSQYLFSHPHGFVDVKIYIDENPDSIFGLKFEWKYDLVISQTIITDYDLDNNNFIDDVENQNFFDYAFNKIRQFNYFIFFESFPVNNELILPTPLIIPEEECRSNILEKIAYPGQMQIFNKFYLYDESRHVYIFNDQYTAEEKIPLQSLFLFLNYYQIENFRSFIGEEGNLIYNFTVPFLINKKSQKKHLKIQVMDPTFYFGFTIKDVIVKYDDETKYIINNKHEILGDLEPNETVITYSLFYE